MKCSEEKWRRGSEDISIEKGGWDDVQERCSERMIEMV